MKARQAHQSIHYQPAHIENFDERGSSGCQPHQIVNTVSQTFFSSYILHPAVPQVHKAFVHLEN
jgi:hypothetical protein